MSPLRASRPVLSTVQGFATVATTYRSLGTNVLTPGRYIGAEEVEARSLAASVTKIGPLFD